MKARAIWKAMLPLVLLAVVAGSAWAEFQRAVYYDTRVDTNWWDATMAKATRDFFVDQGYTEVNGETSVQWMQDRIADRQRSVLVMAMDVVTNQMAATATGAPDPNAVIRQYLNAGGKVVWLGDWPFYGHRDLTAAARSTSGWEGNGSNTILGVAGSNVGDINQDVTLTDAGRAWGLEDLWKTRRAVNNSTAHVILAAGNADAAAGWHRYYSFAGPASGFTRIYDATAGDLPTGQVTPAVLANIKNVAEFPADAPDQLPTASLSGSVKDPAGNPLVNFSFDARNADGLTIRVRTDASGNFLVAALPGEYQLILTGEELDPGSLTINVTVAGTAPSNTEIVVGTTPAFQVDSSNSTGNYRLGATARDLAPAQPDFDDSGFTSLNVASKVEPPQPKVQGYWLRAKFNAPEGFPVNEPAVLYNLSIDDRSYGVWLNGVPLGNNRTGNNPGTMLVPANTLKATDNVLAVLAWNTGGAIGFNGAFRIHAIQKQDLGAVRLQAQGTPLESGGTADGVRIALVDSEGQEVRSATTNVQGLASLTQVPVGTYTARITGALVDGTVEQEVTVAAGAIADVQVPVQGAIGLGTIFQPADRPWKVMAKVDQNNADLWSPGFDDSAWGNAPVPLDLKSGDRGSIGPFGDNEWDAYRLKFQVPAEWQAANRFLILDTLRIDDNDRTYVNGSLVGSVSGWDRDRVYAFPASVLNFGADNNLTVVWENGTGGTGIYGDNYVRLRLANNATGLIQGTVTGPDDQPVGAGVPVVAVSPGGTTIVNTVAGGTFQFETSQLGETTLSAPGSTTPATVNVAGGQGVRADLKINLQTPILNLTDENGFTWKAWIGPQVTGNELLWAPNANESRFVDFRVSDDVGAAGNWDVLDSTDNIFGWLRLTIPADKLPEEWRNNAQGKSLILGGFAFDDVDETYFNGVRIGKTGTFPAENNGDLGNVWSLVRYYVVPAGAVNWTGPNVIAIKGYDGGGGGGFNQGPPRLSVLGLTAGPVTPAKGDVDFSGTTDIADIRHILRVFVAGITLNDAQRTAADVNNSGALDLGDLILLMKAVLLGTPLP